MIGTDSIGDLMSPLILHDITRQVGVGEPEERPVVTVVLNDQTDVPMCSGRDRLHVSPRAFPSICWIVL